MARLARAACEDRGAEIPDENTDAGDIGAEPCSGSKTEAGVARDHMSALIFGLGLSIVLLGIGAALIARPQLADRNRSRAQQCGCLVVGIRRGWSKELARHPL